MEHGLHVKTGTAGGTLLIILWNIEASDLLRTAVLAAVGAMVSYGVSYMMKWMIGRRRPRQ
jgi:hypothetical protein